MHLRSLHLLPAIALFLVAGAAAASPPLVWRGDDTTAQGFVDGMAKAWHQAGHPRITLQPFNTISGIDAVAHGTADIAGSARGRAKGRADEVHLVFTPVAWDALVIVTNRHNPADSLTLKQLHDIYYGKITNWRQLGGRSRRIHVYSVASPTDGVEFSLRRLLFGNGYQPVAAPRRYLNVDKLQRAVELDPQAMGVTTLSNAFGDHRLKMLAIDGTRPTVANVANGSYPLYAPLYLVTRADGDGAKAQRIQQFVAFARSAAVARVMHHHRLIPYADAPALAGHDAQRIASIARATGRHVYHHNGPTAAPGATFAAHAAVAPTSERTQVAHRRMLAARAAAARAAAKVTWYTVVAGDTLGKIAKSHAVSVAELRRWNHIRGNLIRVGQKLAIHKH